MRLPHAARVLASEATSGTLEALVRALAHHAHVYPALPASIRQELASIALAARQELDARHLDRLFQQTEPPAAPDLTWRAEWRSQVAPLLTDDDLQTMRAALLAAEDNPALLAEVNHEIARREEMRVDENAEPAREPVPLNEAI